MSSLHSSLAQRRVEPQKDAAPSCHTVADAVSSVTFTSWKSGVWVLPWIHFLGAHHIAHAKGERISFIFAQHEITAEGVRLALLMPEIAAARLSALREVPERFIVDLPSSAPCVVHLVIKTSGNLPGAGRDEIETSSPLI